MRPANSARQPESARRDDSAHDFVRPALALGALKGDANLDGRFDAADALVVLRATQGSLVLSPEALDAGDVAPFGTGATIGDGTASVGDALVLLRGLSDADLDGDGLSRDVEAALGFSPFSRDSDGDGILDADEDADQDGLSDAIEMLITGTDRFNSDTDGDGYVDSDDAAPTVAAGTLVHWVHADHLGGPAVLTDSGGTVVRRIAYGVFGEIRANLELGPASTPDVDEKFTGQRFDEETGLSYYNARYYDTGIGRFVTADSVITDTYGPQNLNRYAYVLNNPASRIDPSGHFSTDLSFSGGYGGFDPFARLNQETARLDAFSAWVNRIAESSRYRLQVQLANAGSATWYGVKKVTKSIVIDAAALVIGNTYGKAIVFRDDVTELYENLGSGEWAKAVGSFAFLIVDLAFPNYGFFGGLRYGIDQEDPGPWHEPINGLDRNNRTHDQSRGNHFHWGWLESNYSQLPPGPVGAAYILAGTPLFLLGASYQWLGN